MVKLIIDVDTGVDDAWALLILLSSQLQDFEILGITCTHGNTSVDQVCKNTLYLLTTTGRCEVPVFKGANSPIIITERNLRNDCKSYYGENGFGDVDIPSLSLPLIQDESAFEALFRITKQYKGEVTLACLGPLTNIAITARTYPEFITNVKDIYIMGGNYIGIGNTTMCAEFNFHSDPEAAHIVLSSFEERLTLLPWETCLRLKIPFEWRRETLGQYSGKNRVIDLMNKIEEPVMERGKRKGYNNWISCDSFLGALVENPEEIIEKKFESHAVVELGGQNTRGQIVIDHLKTKAHNITIIEALNREKIQERLLAANVFFSK